MLEAERLDSRQEWINDLVRRQDNVDPIRRIPNGALFQGTLIRGNFRLNKRQRAGAVILGVCSLAFGCFGLAQIITALSSWKFEDSTLVAAIYFPLSLWFGWKMTRNALVNNPEKGHKTK